MSWECKYLENTHCGRRNQECDPGAPGCILEGKFVFPFRETAEEDKKDPRKRPETVVTNGTSRHGALFTEYLK